jgi:hypothetical protein
LVEISKNRVERMCFLEGVLCMEIMQEWNLFVFSQIVEDRDSGNRNEFLCHYVWK